VGRGHDLLEGPDGVREQMPCSVDRESCQHGVPLLVCVEATWLLARLGSGQAGGTLRRRREESDVRGVAVEAGPDVADGVSGCLGSWQGRPFAVPVVPGTAPDLTSAS
jgi:hypothetical protein